MIDTLRGDNAQMVRSIEALLSLDAAGALVPHGIGGHARELLESAAVRLAAAAAPVECRASQLPSGWVCDGKACDRCTRNAPTTPPAVMPAAPSDAVTLTAEHRELIDAVMRDTATSVEYRLERIFKVLALRQTMHSQAEPAAGEQAGAVARDAAIELVSFYRKAVIEALGGGAEEVATMHAEQRRLVNALAAPGAAASRRTSRD